MITKNDVFILIHTPCVVSVPQFVITWAKASGMVEFDGLDYMTENIANKDG